MHVGEFQIDWGDLPSEVGWGVRRSPIREKKKLGAGGGDSKDRQGGNKEEEWFHGMVTMNNELRV